MEIDITNWNRISESAFNAFGYDSGILVKNFDPTNFTEPDDDDIICTTTGNITAAMVPTIVDLGSDVNGLHGQFKELQMLQSWAATLGFTALEIDMKTLALGLGAADVTGTTKATPRMYIKQSDFIHNVALIMFRIDGGLTAAVLDYGMSTGGVSITTSKEGKVNQAVTLTGFQSMSAQSTPAMQFYSADPVTEPDIILNRSNIALTVGETENLTATTIPEGETVTWTSGSTSVATVNSSGKVSAAGAGTTTITAKITVDGTDYTDTCAVTVTAAPQTQG